jgi:hypothetical protein
LPEDILFPSINEPELEGFSKFAEEKFKLMRDIFKGTREKLNEFAEKEKIREDSRRYEQTFEIGRKVMVYHQESRTKGESTKLESRFSGPYRIIEILDEGKTYKLWHPQTGKEWVMNVDRIKPFDPWINYEQQNILRQANDPNSSLHSKAPIDPINDNILDGELSEIRGTLTKYNTILANKGNVRKPKRITAARNWKGDWVPYNDDENFEVIRILDRRPVLNKPTFEWLTQWKGDWLPTWESIDLFKNNATTGMGLIWQEFQRKNPHVKGEAIPIIPGAAQRKH